ncbi:ATP-binding protein [Streptomyces kaniharaensis]|uniref:histidine kinase n=1 Tax=Streptomyces kaniharaensis TaxID=212423 RepID=A0A6N7KWN5_9ACTN|nr:ATP-binding protein [Streptomyces kaniharaensis]MQS14414.1 ATP-binding protein [Streptomyces kaniharaensis]
MTQIALIVLGTLAVAAAVTAGLLARSRAGAATRATVAEERAQEAEQRIRATEGRLARAEFQLRELQIGSREAADDAEVRYRAAEERTREAEHRARAAEDAAREAQDAARTADARAAALDTRAAEAERRLAAAEEHAAALLAEIRHLADERVPATAVRLGHAHAPVSGPLAAPVVGPEAVEALQAVLDATVAAVTEERERVDAAARAAMRGATSKIQTLLYQIQSLVQQLQDDNDDPRLLEVDFRNEVALRRIQTVAVLCEAWPGLARTDSPLAEVVVGALSRVPGYARIKVANHLRDNRLAVVARAAEPLAITLAELLANATAYSHPETDIPVTVQQGGRGALVIIDDSGIGMDDDQLRRARRLLAGPPQVLLTELGNPPKTGFAVIGKLARQYGFACHIEPSPYGGMRTILRIPAALVTVVDDEQPLSVLAPLPLRAGAGPAPAPTVQAVPPMRDADEDSGLPVLADRHHQTGPQHQAGLHPAPAMHVVPSTTAGRAGDGSGLPSRRRRQPLAEPAAGPADAPARTAEHRPAAAAEQSARTPERAAAHWRALQQGTGDGRAAVAQAAREGAPGVRTTGEPGASSHSPAAPTPEGAEQ